MRKDLTVLYKHLHAIVVQRLKENVSCVGASATGDGWKAQNKRSLIGNHIHYIREVSDGKKGIRWEVAKTMLVRTHCCFFTVFY
jgi:hypothetical protein